LNPFVYGTIPATPLSFVVAEALTPPKASSLSGFGCASSTEEEDPTTRIENMTQRSGEQLASGQGNTSSNTHKGISERQ
jgi:hypothetical protein